jgi:plasmid stabilization system protein ParE
VKVLEKFPLIGREVSETADRTIRELIVEDYRVIYKIKDDVIEITAIFYAKQNVKKLLPKRHVLKTKIIKRRRK